MHGLLSCVILCVIIVRGVEMSDSHGSAEAHQLSAHPVQQLFSLTIIAFPYECFTQWEINKKNLINNETKNRPTFFIKKIIVGTLEAVEMSSGRCGFSAAVSWQIKVSQWTDEEFQWASTHGGTELWCFHYVVKESNMSHKHSGDLPRINRALSGTSLQFPTAITVH